MIIAMQVFAVVLLYNFNSNYCKLVVIECPPHIYQEDETRMFIDLDYPLSKFNDILRIGMGCSVALEKHIQLS